MSIYCGVENLSKKVKNAYVDVNNKSNKILKIYIGQGNKAKLCYSAIAQSDMPSDTNKYYLYYHGEAVDTLGNWTVTHNPSSKHLCDFQEKSDCLYFHNTVDNDLLNGKIVIDSRWVSGMSVFDIYCLAYETIYIKYDYTGAFYDNSGYICVGMYNANGASSALSFIEPSANKVTDAVYPHVIGGYSESSKYYLGFAVADVREETTIKIKEIWLE